MSLEPLGGMGQGQKQALEELMAKYSPQLDKSYKRTPNTRERRKLHRGTPSSYKKNKIKTLKGSQRETRHALPGRTDRGMAADFSSETMRAGSWGAEFLRDKTSTCRSVPSKHRHTLGCCGFCLRPLQCK